MNMRTDPKRIMPEIESLPRYYGLMTEGDCLSPEIDHGDKVVFDSEASWKPGDYICIYPTEENPNQQPIIKKAVTNLPHDIELPHVMGPHCNVAPVLFVEMINPTRRFPIEANKIRAIHKAIAWGDRANKIIETGDINQS